MSPFPLCLLFSLRTNEEEEEVGERLFTVVGKKVFVYVHLHCSDFWQDALDVPKGPGGGGTQF